VVEGTGLENQQAGNGLVGSNPTPSARNYYYAYGRIISSNEVRAVL
jgi:hypothetical protein